MARLSKELDRDDYVASAGAWALVDEKHKLLNSYDVARSQTRGRRVRAEHGNVAESTLREWLAQFLPKRYGVCRGFILEPWQNLIPGELEHHDVIIYDALNAPVMWVVDNVDTSPERRDKAIPARHVVAVLEVKARLNAKSAREACAKLSSLARFDGSLHSNFLCGYVYFEVDPDAEGSKACLDNLMPRDFLPSLLGGLVLRGNNNSPDVSGWLRMVATVDGSQNLVATTRPLSHHAQASTSREWPTFATRPIYGLQPEQYSGPVRHHLLLMWGLNAFADFVFTLLDALEGQRLMMRDRPLIVGPKNGTKSIEQEQEPDRSGAPPSKRKGGARGKGQP